MGLLGSLVRWVTQGRTPDNDYSPSLSYQALVIFESVWNPKCVNSNSGFAIQALESPQLWLSPGHEVLLTRGSLTKTPAEP